MSGDRDSDRPPSDLRKRPDLEGEAVSVLPFCCHSFIVRGMQTCGLCGHQAPILGGAADDVDLCHEPLDGSGPDHGLFTCYHLWTVYKVRDKADAECVWNFEDCSWILNRALLGWTPAE